MGTQAEAPSAPGSYDDGCERTWPIKTGNKKRGNTALMDGTKGKHSFFLVEKWKFFHMQKIRPKLSWFLRIYLTLKFKEAAAKVKLISENLFDIEIQGGSRLVVFGYINWLTIGSFPQQNAMNKCLVPGYLAVEFAFGKAAVELLEKPIQCRAKTLFPQNQHGTCNLSLWKGK